MSARFPKILRLLKKYQFLRVVRHGKRHVGNFLFVESAPNHLDFSRLGLTVSKKYGKAVKRNRFKRLVREAFRQSLGQIPTGYDIHIKPRSRAQAAGFSHIAKELNFLLRFETRSF